MKCYILIRHKVRDYSNWRFEFDALLSWRQTQGEKKQLIFRDDIDPNIVTLLLEWANVDSANNFISDSQLSEMMQVSGVVDQPQVNVIIKD